MDILWYDAEALNGKGMPGEYSSSEEQNLGPSNARECPCIPCERSAECKANLLSCDAFRKWCNTGNYSDDSLMIKLKSI